MSPIDFSRATPINSAAGFDRWLEEQGMSQPEVIVAIYKASTHKQHVTLLQLQEIALCHGWVDTQTKRIDDERYAIRFVPRTPRSTWGAKNRAMAARMLAAGRVEPAGLATIPADVDGR